MNPPRTRVLVALLAAAALVFLGLTAAGLFPGAIVDDSTDPGPDDADDVDGFDADTGPDADDRPADPSTADTVGYVDGYWYDDELPVDDRDDAVVDDDELEAVVYRSMARVEVIRELTFEDDVPVDVISREEFQAEDDLFVELDEDARLQQNVHYEALFMVDRETDALDETESLYGGAVGGYYDPATDQVVLVSDSPETPEVDEVILGHELLHALQDQHFDLQGYDRETIDRDNAKNGLIEGDAVWVEDEYDQRCDAEWDCLVPTGGPEEPPEPNWGLYLTVYQPYSDGPDYVEYLLDQGGWDAVNDAYDEPPASSSAVIRPGDEREPAAIEVEDASNDEWRQIEAESTATAETVGEAGMVAMLGGGAFESGEPSVLSQSDLVGFDLGFDYDHAYTDGWAGDQLVAYVHDDGLEANETPDAVEHTGYVWQTEWTAEEDAEQFLTGYLELVDGYGAEPVDEYRNTFEIEDADGYPGAYFLDHDGETVTIVRAPSVDALDAVDEGAAPSGEDTIDVAWLGESDGDTGTDDGDDAAEDEDAASDDDDSLAGVAGAPPAAAAVVLGTTLLLAGGRVRGST